MDLLSLQDKLDYAKKVTKLKPIIPADATSLLTDVIVLLDHTRLSCDVDFKPEISEIKKARKQIRKRDWDKALRNLEKTDKEIYVKMSECALAEP